MGQNCGHYRDFTENIGIFGAPVIDEATQTLFVVARTKEQSGFVQRLHARHHVRRRQAEQFRRDWRQHSGKGRGLKKGVLTFNPEINIHRGSLLLANGTVYITWASHCDTGRSRLDLRLRGKDARSGRGQVCHARRQGRWDLAVELRTIGR